MRYEIEQDGMVLIHMQNKARTEAWVERLAPGETERAEALLDTEALAAVQAVWTPEVIDAWQQAHPDYEPPELPGPELPSHEERLAAVEDALLELALGGLL